jgi:ankyrin repeat protein
LIKNFKIKTELIESIKMDSIPEHLECPITSELLDDPVSVPCGHTFGRTALVNALAVNALCPVCRTDLIGFDAESAPKNIAIAGLVDIFRGSRREISVEDHAWTSTITHLVNHNGDVQHIGELEVKIERSKFSVRPSLFVIAADRSGSMGGSPWKQVEKALIYITAMCRQNPMIQIKIIGYDSNAQIIELTGIENLDTRKIKSMFTGGGTNFSAAFQKIREVLAGYMCSSDPADELKDNNVGSATVVFLTDGQDAYSGFGSNRYERIDTFKNQLAEEWVGPISVHSVGFGGGCDRHFLERIWKTGNVDGTFRYAAPEDDGDTLCSKLQGVFDVASKSSSIPVSLEISPSASTAYAFMMPDGTLTKKHNISFPISESNRGNFKCWVVDTSEELSGEEAKDSETGPLEVVINTNIDENHKVPIQLKDATMTTTATTTTALFAKWLGHLTDQLAVEVMSIVERKSELDSQPHVLRLHTALIKQRINKMKCASNNVQTNSKLDFIYKQVEALSSGRYASIDMNKLSDLRFGSIYDSVEHVSAKSGTISSRPQHHSAYTHEIDEQKQIAAVPEWTERRVRYSLNNTGRTRNPLQEAISSGWNILTDEIRELIDAEATTMEDILFKDIDGNNTLHLLCYCGHSDILKYILTDSKFATEITKETLEIENADGETPLTLAIKKRGFWKLMQLLFNKGTTIPSKRKKALEKYAIAEGYIKTADILRCMGDDPTEVNDTMPAEFIQFQYDKVTEGGMEFDAQKYLNVALAKCMIGLSRTLIEKHGAKPTLEMLYDHCYPKKPDAEDTPLYLELSKLVIEATPELINSVDENNENPLFKACEKGSNPHVQYYIAQGTEIDKPNNLGNTPLWISCAKKYPCIIEELLNAGANVNHVNLKGNGPLYPICQRGPAKIAETLLSFGADPHQLNTNKDTLPLLCCRNGQHEVLKVFLNYIDPEFINFKAHIDGFNAIMACAEQNRSECIRELYKYGTDLNQKTDDDNIITNLRGVTPMHIAAYYNRFEALQTLIVLGADVNAGDINGQTPLHFAVIQGNIPVIQLLVNSGNTVLNKKDTMGLTPLAYCRNREDIRAVLVNPVLDILMDLARGVFSSHTEEVIACEILKNRAHSVGCLTQAEAVTVEAVDGSTPLQQAVIHTNFNVTQTLLDMGADPMRQNSYNVDCYMWANWLRNPRIKKMLPTPDEEEKEFEIESSIVEMLTKMNTYAKVSIPDRMVLMMTNKPKQVATNTSSGISTRMEGYMNILRKNYKYDFEDFDKDILCLEEGASASASSMALATVFNKKYATIDIEKDLFDALLWNAKTNIVNKLMSPETSEYVDGFTLTPQEQLAINLYTSSADISSIINNTILHNEKDVKITMRPYIQALYSSLGKLPAFEGEVFIGSNTLDRSLFKLDTGITWMTFMSGSTMWRVATEHMPNFASKKKEGTVVLVKSKTGRLVTNNSQFPFDGEVIFHPNTKFKVNRWYIGDVICLGQENIREHTFKIKPEDMAMFDSSNKSLIIELVEQAF